MKTENLICPFCDRRTRSSCANYNIAYCQNCELDIQIPFPTEQRLAEIYNHEYYLSWGNGENPCMYWTLKRELFKTLLSITHYHSPVRKALDIGCATGACLSVFVDHGFDAYGVDINETAVITASSRVPGATIKHGTLEAARLAKNSFDLIILSDVIEHISNPDGLIAEVSLLLSPGGKVIILTPDIQSLSRKIFMKYWPHYKEEHLVLFNQKSLHRLIERNGLSVEKMAPFRKPISFAYLKSQLKSYPLPILSRLIATIGLIVPSIIAERTIHLPMGECVAVATKS